MTDEPVTSRSTGTAGRICSMTVAMPSMIVRPGVTSDRVRRESGVDGRVLGPVAGDVRELVIHEV